MKNNIAIIKLILFLLATPGHAQDLMTDVNANLSLENEQAKFSEKINTISRSGKIFILTNSNQIMGKGDFITLLLKQGGPVARAVVAKTHSGRVGIKVLKVYSLTRWNQINRGMDIDIIRGDDAFLFKKIVVKSEEPKIEETIESEEDLFNDKEIVEKDLTDFYKDNRLIKPDSIVTVGYNQLSFKDQVTGDTVASNQYNIAWAYQFADNYWIEGLFGNATASSYPAQGSSTSITNLTARLKYTFKLPLYSYLIPYIGFQTYSVSSPDAGIVVNGNTETAQAEEETINNLEESGVIFGATVLRRLVPGWFVKLDLGTDIVNIGIGIEF
jgi:hypothetical protein